MRYEETVSRFHCRGIPANSTSPSPISLFTGVIADFLFDMIHVYKIRVERPLERHKVASFRSPFSLTYPSLAEVLISRVIFVLHRYPQRLSFQSPDPSASGLLPEAHSALRGARTKPPLGLSELLGSVHVRLRISRVATSSGELAVLDQLLYLRLS